MADTDYTLKEIQNMIRKFCDHRNWDQFHNPKDLAISLNLEASEVLEHFQWKNEQEIVDHLKDNKEDVGHELADTLYWVLLIANKLDINLSEAFYEKMKKNERKYPIEKAKDSHKKYTELG